MPSRVFSARQPIDRLALISFLTSTQAIPSIAINCVPQLFLIRGVWAQDAARRLEDVRLGGRGGDGGGAGGPQEEGSRSRVGFVL